MKRKWVIRASAITCTLVLCIVSSHCSIEGVETIEQEAIEILEKYAKKLDNEKFFSDPILVQKKIDGGLTYTYGSTGKVVLANDKLDDFGRETIVVGSEENQFAIPTPREGTRRQFILLKKAPSDKTEDEGVDYYVSFAFLRNFQDNETYTEVVEVGGTKSVAEFDIWEHRSARFLPGWNNCDFSLMFTCTTLRAMASEAKKKAKVKGRRKRSAGKFNKVYSRVKRDDDDEDAFEPVALIPIEVPMGYDKNSIKDLYFDFDYHRFKDETLSEQEREEQERINKQQKKVAKKSRRQKEEDKGNMETNWDNDEEGLIQDLNRIEEERKAYEEKNVKDEKDEEKGDAGTETEGHSRKKRQILEDEEIAMHNRDRLKSMVTAMNSSMHTVAYLYEAPLGITEAPGIKSIMLVGETDNDFKNLLDAETVEAGVLILKTGPDMPGMVMKRGILDKRRGDKHYRLLSEMKRGNKFGEQGQDEDAILMLGNSRLNAWDMVNWGTLGLIVPFLCQAGIGFSEAKLNVVGSQIAENAGALIIDGLIVGWRLGTDTVGTSLNAGPYRRKGFRGSKSYPSNAAIMFGIVIPGAGVNGQKFFFPWSSLSRATYIYEKIELPGYFTPGLPGSPDGFFPDDPGAAKAVYGARGRIIPEGFPKEEKELGVWGFLREGYVFNADVTKHRALYDRTALEWKAPGNQVWMPATKDDFLTKPNMTTENKKVLYGRILPGMLESPHLFVADGDSISGHFIPNDDNFPHLVESAHGVLTPSYLGGHAMFYADSLKEVQFFKELRGVFVPDAMGYEGGVSGILSRTDVDPQKFIFHLDRPAVEFMYIEGYPDTKYVWSPYLKPGQWKWEMVMTDDDDPDATDVAVIPTPDDHAEEAVETESHHYDHTSDDYTDSCYGSKITTRKTDAFIPLDFVVSGTLILVPLNYNNRLKVYDADLIGNRPDTPMNISVSLDSNPVSLETLQAFSGATAIFIPHKFPKGDAIVATYRAGRLKITQPIKSHFMLTNQDVWTPIGFRERMAAGGGAEGKEEASDQAEKEAKEKEKPEQTKKGMPGVLTKPRPPTNKIANYKFGSLHDPNSEEMTENYINLDILPHYYTFGYFMKSKDSSFPVFIPETGILGTFTPSHNAAIDEPVYYFPPRGNLTGKFMFQNPHNKSVNSPVKGRFRPLYRKGSVGYLSVKYNKSSLTVVGTPDIIPGWRQIEEMEINPEDLPKGWEKVLGQSRLQSSKKILKYALVELGGGFKGVVVQGAESVDDPNNPIFQQFLHYKAMRDGDVNPWGLVNIVDPIERDEMPPHEQVKEDESGIFGGVIKLGTATFVDEMTNPETMAWEVMKQFSVRHWEYKKVGEVLSGKKRSPLTLGDMENVVNMMDFRMFLFTRFSLKRAKFGQDLWARLYVPFGADQFLTVKKKAKPPKKLIQRIQKSGSSLSLVSKSASVNFAVHFQMDPKEIIKFERPAGESVPNMDDDLTHHHVATFDEWGDETVCDEITLDPFQTAQLTAAMQKGDEVTGMDLGRLLTAAIGYDGKFSKIVKRLLEIIDDAGREKLKEAKNPPPSEGPQMTDLLGGVKEEVEKKAIETTPEDEKTPKGRTFTVDDHDHDHAKILHGWKTQFRGLETNATLSEEGVIFYGIGNCKQKEVPNVKNWNSNKPNKILKYFLRVLRIDCMENSRQRVMNLINEGYLELDKETKFFRIPYAQKATRSLRVTPVELKKLSVAYEFHSFTRTYYFIREKGYLKTAVLKEPYCTVSRSVAYLTEFSFYVITRAPRMIPAHAVRMIRNLLSTLRTVMTKLYQDNIILDECNGCIFDKSVNQGDQFRITSLIQFIINGMGEFEAGEILLRPAFHKFVEMNVAALKQRVYEFGRQFPRTIPVIHAAD